MKKMVFTLSSLILEFWILLSHLLFTNRLKHEVNRTGPQDIRFVRKHPLENQLPVKM